jgi:hypothetical protein
MRTVYREKKYVCGEYLDVFIYPVFADTRGGGGRRTKGKSSTETQRKLNQRHREEKLTRLLHANFTPDDVEIHLTYRAQPESDEAAKRNAANYIRRVSRYTRKHGLGKLKYIVVTERGKKGGRYHHHITIGLADGGKLDRDALEKLWNSGYANSRRLQFTEEGLAGLGRYIVKSPVGKRAWSASKNLLDPKPKTRDGRISARKAQELADNIQDCGRFEDLYPGYLMSAAEVFHNEVNGGCYLVARFYRKNGKFISMRRRN